MSARETEQARMEGGERLMEEESAGGLLLGAVLRTVTSGALGVMLHPGKVRWNVPCYTFSLPLVCSKPD